jgi:hypothetical protein
MRLAGPAVVDQAKALPLEILEVERLARVALDDVAVSDAFLFEALLPPLQTLLAGDTQPSARDAVRTRFSGFTAQSKKVMSVPGVASPSA